MRHGVCVSDLRGLDVNLLRVLDVLLEEQNVTRTAERLDLTQSTVSGALRRLRDIFGDPLFVRQQRGLLPTPRGLALVGPVKEALASIGRVLDAEPFDPARTERVFTISASDYAQLALLPRLAERLAREAPGSRLATRPTNRRRAHEELANGRLDLWLTIPEAASGTLRARTLWAETYVCAMRAGHGLAGGPMSLEAFAAARHVVVSPERGEFRAATDIALAAVGRSRSVVMSTDGFAVVPAVLAASDLIAMLPSRLVAGDSRLAAVAPPVAVPGFALIAAWHERLQQDPAHAWLRALVADIAGESQ